MSKKVRLFIILGIEVVVLVALLLIIFFAGRKVYTVTFDLDGGNLISGDLEQQVMQGNDATPPNATKDGCYFLQWSTSYKKITKDTYVKAIWEYETTPGIEYEYLPNSNYCVISGCYEKLSGDVYIGAYYEDGVGENIKNIKVLGIKDGAFENCSNITGLYFLDGIIDIGDNAFKNCTSLKTIELPDTTESIGANAFENCSQLLKITLPQSLDTLASNAFKNCTLLSKIILPDSLINLGSDVFSGCTSLNIYSETKASVASWDPLWNSSEHRVSYDVKEMTIDEVTYKYVIDASENIVLLECQSENEIIVVPEYFEIGNKNYFITQIEAYTFSSCLKLVEATIPNSITHLEEAIFSGCHKLEQLTIPFIGSEVGNSGTAEALFGHIFGVPTQKAENTISQDYGLEQSIVYAIPLSLVEVIITKETVIGYGAFSNCIDLSLIALPSKLSAIHDYGFANCENLSGIIIGSAVETMGEQVFLNCPNLRITCEMEELPSTWNVDWNPDNRPVSWE